jgi:parallel beta-helix repeat protein
MSRLRPHALYAGAALGFGLVALLEKPVAARRPTPPEMRTAIRILVTSEQDSGPASLRWALYAAASAQGRVGIEIHSSRIVLETPLPPVLNPAGVVLEAPGAGVEIDGRAVPTGALLDIDAPGSVIRGLRFRGAAGQAILVRSQGVALRGLTFTDCEEGIHVLSGSQGVTVEDSAFDQNGTGVNVDADVSGVSIHDNRFRKHDKAAVWAVSARPSQSSAPLVIVRNRFEDDRISLVLIDVPARVEDNQFLRPAEAGVYLTGGQVVRRNRVDAGASVGILTDAADGAVLEENEVSNCLAVGILLRQSRNTELRRNRLFGNGYGVAVVLDHEGGGPSVIASNLVLNQSVDGLFMVGASPVVQDNRILGNRQAGLRILDYIPIRGARLAGLPVVRDNVLDDNRWNEIRGEYREPPPAKPRP